MLPPVLLSLLSLFVIFIICHLNVIINLWFSLSLFLLEFCCYKLYYSVKWFELWGNRWWCSLIVQASEVLRRTVVGSVDRCFDNLSRSHTQIRVKWIVLVSWMRLWDHYNNYSIMYYKYYYFMWIRISYFQLILSSLYNCHRNLILHCIDLLKSCHVLTEQLVAHTMESSGTIKSPTEMDKIVTAAKNIRPRYNVFCFKASCTVHYIL